jgi:arginine repressor
MVRCHRSFMVNIIKINHIKKVGKARYVVLNNTEIKPIPVSKSYFKNLVERIDKYNASATIAENTTTASNTPIISTEEVVEPSQEGRAE